MEQTDSELVILARSGDREAFSRLVARHQSRAVRVARRMVPDEDAARELVQEAILQAYLSLDRLREDTRFPSWFHGIVLNVCRRYVRDHQRECLSWEDIERETGAAMLAARDPERIAEDREQQRLVLDAVHTLSPENRDATLLFYYERLSLREVAATLGISIGAVKGRLFQSRKQLRQRLLLLYPEETTAMRQTRRKKMVRVSLLPVSHGSEQMDREDPTTSEAHARRFLLRMIMSNAPHQTRDAVGLMERGGPRFLPVRTAGFAGRIAAVLSGSQKEIAPALGLMLELLKAGETTPEEVRIESLDGDSSRAAITLRQGGARREVEARPADGIILAAQAGLPISVADELLQQGAWDLSDALSIVERLLDTSNTTSLRRAAEEPFLVRIADGIVEHLASLTLKDGTAELRINARQMGGPGSPFGPCVYMTYHYAGNVGGGNVAMPLAALPVLIARFKLMAGLDLGQRAAPQQGRTSIRCLDKEYDLLVSTEPASAPDSAPGYDPFGGNVPVPESEGVMLRLQQKAAA